MDQKIDDLPLKLVIFHSANCSSEGKSSTNWWGLRWIAKLVHISPITIWFMVRLNNKLVTGANLNQRSHHWGASHCTNWGLRFLPWCYLLFSATSLYPGCWEQCCEKVLSDLVDALKCSTPSVDGRNPASLDRWFTLWWTNIAMENHHF